MPTNTYLYLGIIDDYCKNNQEISELEKKVDSAVNLNYILSSAGTYLITTTDIDAKLKICAKALLQKEINLHNYPDPEYIARVFWKWVALIKMQVGALDRLIGKWLDKAIISNFNAIYERSLSMAIYGTTVQIQAGNSKYGIDLYFTLPEFNENNFNLFDKGTAKNLFDANIGFKACFLSGAGLSDSQRLEVPPTIKLINLNTILKLVDTKVKQIIS